MTELLRRRCPGCLCSMTRIPAPYFKPWELDVCLVCGTILKVRGLLVRNER